MPDKTLDDQLTEALWIFAPAALVFPLGLAVPATVYGWRFLVKPAYQALAAKKAQLAAARATRQQANTETNRVPTANKTLALELHAAALIPDKRLRSRAEAAAHKKYRETIHDLGLGEKHA